jgi:hypothetical protein
VTVLFDVADFDQVAEIMQARRRRQVSEQERQRLAELSARHSPFRISKPQFHERPATQTARVDC